MRLLAILLFVAVYSQIGAQVNLSDGLVYYLDFNNDVIDNQHNSSIRQFGTITFEDDFLGSPHSAVKLGGVTSYLELENSFDFNPSNEFTISLWVKIPTEQKILSSVVNSIISKWILPSGDHNKRGYPYTLRIYNQTHPEKGRIVFANFDGLDANCNNSSVIISKSPLDDNEFHHIILAKEGDALFLFIDCELVGEAVDVTNCATANSANILIGARNETLHFDRTNNFVGTIDEVRFYDRMLNHDEIQVLCSKVNTDDSDCKDSQLYPNPFADQLYSRNEEQYITIYDIYGRMIAAGTLNEMDFSLLPDALYIIKTELCDKNYKIVKISR